MVIAEHVWKKFESRRKKVQALKDVSFAAEPGKIFGLLGPNGAGKTTMLRTVATLLKQDEGDVTVNGFNTQTDGRKVRDCIGFLTSDMRLSGNLSPRELLRFFAELNRIDRDKTAAAITRLSEYLDMKDFMDKPVLKLSTGMKQKAAIAVSLIHDPGVIVFDEPTSGLDVLASKVVLDFLKDFREKQKTIILSTHNLFVAEKMCDVIAIIMKGEIIDQGPLGELLGRHDAESLESLFYTLARERGMLNHVA